VSAVAESARVAVLLADYAAGTPDGKVNILGGGWQVMGLVPETGATPALCLSVTIEVAPDHFDEDFAVEIALYDESGDIVKVPSPTGELIPMRVSQSAKAERPNVPGYVLPSKALWAHSQLVLNFPAGLPLSAGHTYEWRVRLDGDETYTWPARFHIVGSAPQAVMG
jgi:hypothetical protein